MRSYAVGSFWVAAGVQHSRKAANIVWSSGLVALSLGAVVSSLLHLLKDICKVFFPVRRLGECPSESSLDASFHELCDDSKASVAIIAAALSGQLSPSMIVGCSTSRGLLHHKRKMIRAHLHARLAKRNLCFPSCNLGGCIV